MSSFELTLGMYIGEWINCQNGPFFFSSFTQYANHDSYYTEMQCIDRLGTVLLGHPRYLGCH